MQPIYVSKSLVAASSNLVGSISTAATPVVTVNSSNMPLDTQRRIVFTSTAADTSTLTLTITGTRQGGGTLTESVKGSTAGAGTNASTLQDFLTVTAISASSNANVPILVGTSSVGGTPWCLTNWHISPLVLGAAITLSSSANSMTGVIDFTMDDPTRVYPDPSNANPVVFNSTTHVCTAASTNTWGVINADINNVGVPIAAWRLTITSSSSSAGTVSAAVIQAGIG